MDFAVCDFLGRPVRSVEDWTAVPPAGHRHPRDLDFARRWLEPAAPAALRALLDRNEWTAGLVIGSAEVKARRSARHFFGCRYHDLLLSGVVAGGPIVISVRAERPPISIARVERIDEKAGTDYAATIVDDVGDVPVGGDFRALSAVAATLAATASGGLAAVVTQSSDTDDRPWLAGPYRVAKWPDVPLWLGRLGAGDVY
jgi:hypothetical protein